MSNINRRDFLKTSLLGGIVMSYSVPLKGLGFAGILDQLPASVALTTGDNRADLVFRALQPYSMKIKTAIGNRRVILKPNNVNVDKPLCATHADTLEGVLEFLRSIRKTDNVVIAESAANGPAFEGFDNYGYFRLAKKYKVNFVDLDHEGYEIAHVFNETDFKPHAVRLSNILLDPDSYIISAAKMKTHDLVVVTLSLKNIVVGAPIKDKGFLPGKGRNDGKQNDKRIVHGGGFRGVNYNLFSLTSHLQPHLAVIDGFEGMEGNGPVRGTPVDHRVCVVSTDWLAADRVAVELMGVDFSKIPYLNYCAQAGLGIADLSKIEIVGEPVARHIKTYKLSDNIENQLNWIKSPS